MIINVERCGLGRSYYHASSTRKYHFTICDSSKYKRVCWLGRVRLLLWVCLLELIYFDHRRTKKKDIYVISTLKRPVPLEHYLYANRDIYKIVAANENKISTIG